MGGRREEEPKPSTRKENDASLWRLLNLGVQLAGTVAVFVAVGWWLDNRFGWSPWGVLIAGMLGISAGLYQFVKDAS
ncbi:MAG TPA: AtpZ/AtpI family protein [Planctomycetota bacterium]